MTIERQRGGRALYLSLLALGAVAGCEGGGPSGEAADAGSDQTPCTYPEFSGTLAPGETLPTFAWSGIVLPDDSRGDFSTRDFFCSDRYDQYSSLILVVGAGWCSACPAYIDTMNQRTPSLEAQGALVVYVEVETASFEPASSADAAEFIDDSIAPDFFEGGYRIGDGDSVGEERLRTKLSTFPSGYFIRRRDMRIIADQSQSIYVLDYEGLAADPEQSWTPQLPPFAANCDPTESEEPGEPNDSFEQANLIEPTDDEVSGGVCMPGSDFYQVTLAGPWRFDLYQNLFQTSDPDAHDLNLRLWSTSMERLGGSNIRGNHDWVDYEGAAYVEVYGENNASGTYRVSLSAR